MKYLITTLVLLLSCQTGSDNNILSYEKEILESVNTLKQHQQQINLEIDSSNRRAILSVAFPEIIRFNKFQDLIESYTNDILYVTNGSKISNLSIGLFQMKPSFIEDLEHYIEINKDLTQYSNFIITDNSEKNCRAERYRRLNNTNWQLKYLNVFWYVAEHRFRNKEFQSLEDKISFYATAYNCGIYKTDTTIEAMRKKQNFPFGKNYLGNQVAFSEFSVNFYSKYSLIFNN